MGPEHHIPEHWHKVPVLPKLPADIGVKADKLFMLHRQIHGCLHGLPAAVPQHGRDPGKVDDIGLGQISLVQQLGPHMAGC